MNVIIRCKREERELIRWWRRSTRRDRVVIKADYVGWSRFRVHPNELGKHSVIVILPRSSTLTDVNSFLVDSPMIGNICCSFRSAPKQFLAMTLLLACSVSAETEPIADEFAGLKKYVPPGIDPNAPPEPVSTTVVFLNRNPEGDAERLVISPVAGSQWTVSRQRIPESRISKLSESHFVFDISETPDELRRQLPTDAPNPFDSESECPLPLYFSVVSDETGVPIGEIDFENTNRPDGADLQWLRFDFYTENYQGSRSHAPIVLRHEDTLHGWGAFFGDNSGSPIDGCGEDSEFNTQIEGWVVYGDSSPYPGNGLGPYWQSNTRPSSCQSELTDGPVWYGPGVSLPRYRMVVHSASSYWTAYEVSEYSVDGGWSVVSPWTDLNTAAQGDGTGWPYPPPPYNVDAEGIFIGATKSDGNVNDWKIHFSNVQCGWR